MDGMEALKALKEGKTVKTIKASGLGDWMWRFDGYEVVCKEPDDRSWHVTSTNIGFFLKSGEKFEIVRDYPLTFAEALKTMAEVHAVECKHTLNRYYMDKARFIMERSASMDVNHVFTEAEAQSAWRVVE